MGCARPRVSHFVNLWKTEAEREQPVLLAHGPRAGKAKALAQPQHGLEALDGPPGCVEGLKAAHPRHGSLHPEVGVVRGSACQAATASSVNQTVRLPRWRKAASYSAQFVIRRRCLGI